MCLVYMGDLNHSVKERGREREERVGRGEGRGEGVVGTYLLDKFKKPCVDSALRSDAAVASFLANLRIYTHTHTHTHTH